MIFVSNSQCDKKKLTLSPTIANNPIVDSTRIRSVADNDNNVICVRRVWHHIAHDAALVKAKGVTGAVYVHCSRTIGDQHCHDRLIGVIVRQASVVADVVLDRMTLVVSHFVGIANLVELIKQNILVLQHF